MIGPNPWAILGVLVAILVAGVGGYVKGYTDADRSAQVEDLTEKLAAAKAAGDELRRQVQASQLVERAAVARSIAAETAAANTRAQIDAFANLAARPGDDCAGLTDDDARRLRAIGGAPDTADSPSDAAGRLRSPGRAPDDRGGQR